MTDFTSVEIPRPLDWQAFERHSRLLFERLLCDPLTQNNGRNGQPQHGVDVFGRRDGTRHYVGVQCKGKGKGKSTGKDYGKGITDAELRRELLKARMFTPPIGEFILITTAPDDAKIQETARILEQQEQAAGWDIRVSVWGWGTLQQRITQFPDVIEAFAPDGTPFMGELREAQRSTRDLVDRRSDIVEGKLDSLAQVITPDFVRAVTSVLGRDIGTGVDLVDKHLNEEIDGYRDLLLEGKPKTAAGFLERLRAKLPTSSGSRTKFRVLTNLAIARHQLGDLDSAAELFLEAATIQPSDPLALANKAAGLLIKGNREQAHSTAIEAAKAHPAREEIALQLLQSRPVGSKFADAWAALPEEITNKPDLVAFRIRSLREEGDASWRDVASEAIQAHPENSSIQILQAESVLDKVLATEGRGEHTGVTPDEANGAADKLQAVWKEQLQREGVPDMSIAHNAALMFNALGNFDTGALILDQSFARGNQSVESRQLRMALYVHLDDIPGALALASSLPDTSSMKVMLGELIAETEPAKARDVLREREKFTELKEIIGAADVYVRTFIAEKKYDDAVEEAKRLVAALPGHPLAYSLLHTARMARGDADAETELERAIAAVKPDTDFPTRFFLGVALTKAEQYDRTVDLLFDAVPTSMDGPVLRMLVNAAVAADRRQVLSTLLGALPKSLQSLPYYRRARAALALKVGSLEDAERDIRAYLDVRPRSLDMFLHLLQVHYAQDKINELRELLQKPPTAFDGSPEEFLELAQYEERFGDWRAALRLAYRTWLLHKQNPTVHKHYAGLFLRPGRSIELDVSPSVVGASMAVELSTVDGLTTYIIEPDQALRISPYYIGLEHPLAASLLGKSVEESIVLPDGTPGKIATIKPKELHALHETMERFQNLFPHVEGLERVRFDPSSAEGMEPVASRVRERHDAVNHVFDIKQNAPVPFAIVAAIMGGDALDAFRAYVAHGRPFRVCAGTHDEREVAHRRIRENNRRGCVVDDITLHIVRRLNLGDAVREVCGPIGVLHTTLLRLKGQIDELESRIDEPDMSLQWEDGHVVRTEHPVAFKKKALEQLKDDHSWLLTSADVLPAQGKLDLSQSARKLLAEFGSRLLDVGQAAQGSGRMLLVEDMAMRRLLETEFAVEGTWLQPVLMKAREVGALSPMAYAEAIADFIRSKFEFISIDALAFRSALEGQQTLPLPTTFTALASKLHDKNVDIAANVNVALNAILVFWGDRPFVIKHAATNALLNALVTGRTPDDVQRVIATFHKFGLQQLADGGFIELLAQWRRGHFL